MEENSHNAHDAIVKIPLLECVPLWTGEIIDVRNGIVASVMPPRIRLFECARPFVKSYPIGKFEVCANVPGIIAAGGCVSQIVNSGVLPPQTEAATILATDLDLYPRANSAAEVTSIAKRLCEYLAPVGDVVMSKYAITFTVDGDVFKNRVLKDANDSTVMAHRQPLYYGGYGPRLVYKVQLIAHPIPNTGDLCRDLESLFAHYDFPCCKFATDGRDVYASGDAISTVFETRINRVHWTRLYSPKRVAKYYKRRYDFEIEMPDGSVMSAMPGGCENTAAAVEEIRRLVREPFPPGTEELGMSSEHENVVDDYAQTWLERKRREQICPLYNDGGDDAYTCYANKIVVQSGDKGAWWVLDAAFDRYLTLTSPNLDKERKYKPEFDIICGDPSDMEYMITTGKIPKGAVADWSMMRMNKFCEELCLFIEKSVAAGAGVPVDADAERQRFEKDITGFLEAVSESEGLRASFADGHHLEYEAIDADEFTRRWISPNAKRPRPADTADHHADPAEPAGTVQPEAAVPLTNRERYRFSDADLASLCLYDAVKTPMGIKFRISTSQHAFNKLKIYVPRMWLPAGITQLQRGNGHGYNVSALLSTGNEHCIDPKMLAFKAFMQEVDDRLEQLLKDAKWPARPYGLERENCYLGLSSNMYVTYDSTGADCTGTYPPSITVRDGPGQTVIAKEGPGDTLEAVSWNNTGSSRIAVGTVITLEWVFRKLNRTLRKWHFSSRWTLSEMLLR